ncbi:hypothetical protein QTP70_009371 [Hemibagrus guttatus]|uniref:Alkylated DNA repair protein AlkB homologue 8 N-terminal domain-containing protein n=1 Tax=Hemibagrus guttatus TaxID=175788 RepID=A0AAE0USS5_9TELE|nr:hypothetical protein QTP70_009371 [Hemibagrus guttatus]
MAVKRVSSFRFLGTHISEDLSWTINTSSLVKKAHQHLFYLNTLKKNYLSSTILVNFYHCTIESILTNCITVWYGNCSVPDRKALQREVKTAQRIIGTPLPAIEDIQKKCCLRWAHSILFPPCPQPFQTFTIRKAIQELSDQNQQTKVHLFSYTCLPSELCPPLNPFVFPHHNTLLIPPSD